MSYFICGICGYIAMDSAPEKCPVCTAPQEKFTKNDAVFEESKAKAAEGAAKHVPAIWLDKETKLYPGSEFITIHAKIGEVPHPMEEKHFIQFIDIYADNKWIKRAHFTPAVVPSITAHLRIQSSKVTVIENCNLHGYWMNEIKL